MAETIKVLYVGDSAAQIDPVIIASPFELEVKGFRTWIVGQALIDALQADPNIQVNHMLTWEALAKFPETPKDMSAWDVIILSDIEKDVLLLYPFSRWSQVPMGPNRLQSLKEWVASGGAFVMCGGWTSYTGKGAKAGYGDTPVQDILPVDCLPVTDDRVETPESAPVTVLKDHPILAGIPKETWPVFMGYNKTRLKPGADLLATINGDPLLAVWEYGQGRVMALTSDVSPHWGVDFIKWAYYRQFWQQAMRWLAKREE